MSFQERRQESTISKDAVCKGDVEHPVHIRAGAELHKKSFLGAYGFLNVGSIVYGNVTIGRFFSGGRNFEIGVARHPTHTLSTHPFQFSNSWFPRTVEIENKNKIGHIAHPRTTVGSDVWMGAQAIVASGVTIGHGAVIAANSVVTRDVEPYAIVGGSPAKLIRYRFDEPTRNRLLAVKWWELDIQELAGLPFDDIEACLVYLEGSRPKT